MEYLRKLHHHSGLVKKSSFQTTNSVAIFQVENCNNGFTETLTRTIYLTFLKLYKPKALCHGFVEFWKLSRSEIEPINCDLNSDVPVRTQLL